MKQQEKLMRHEVAVPFSQAAEYIENLQYCGTPLNERQQFQVCVKLYREFRARAEGTKVAPEMAHEKAEEGKKIVKKMKAKKQ